MKYEDPKRLATIRTKLYAVTWLQILLVCCQAFLTVFFLHWAKHVLFTTKVSLKIREDLEGNERGTKT